ncbi:MAG: flagellar motor protein MotB [Candidatus Muiribacteriota bacterium]
MPGKKKKKEEGGAPEWMVTFGDCMTLLLCFFVLLFSMSTIDEAKFIRIIESFQGAFGVLDAGDVVSEGELKQARDVREMMDFSDETEEEDMEELQEQEDREIIMDLVAVQQALEEAGIEISVFDIPEKGITVRIEDRALFETGSAQWNPNYNLILDKVGEVLNNIDRNVEIEGHTDDVPIGPRLKEKFPTNWELSAIRATNVVRYFVEEEGLDGSRFASAGYGEYRPVAPNRNPDGSRNHEGMRQNRRVDIVILND